MVQYVFYDPKDHEIRIRGLSITRLKNRITDTFSSSNMVHPVNGQKYLSLFNKMEYITWEETEISFFSFFALEIYEILTELADKYNDYKYAEAADELYKKTWISNYEKKTPIKTDTLPLLQFTLKPKDFQLEFIKNYETLKFKYDLEGQILSFEQGLGKTFTSIALGECLKKEIFYIVCPNSLKEVWGDEIKKYYIKYKNDEYRWIDECYISGISKVLDSTRVKFIIINQESIPNIYGLVKPEKDSIIIVDESHNFRGNITKRVQDLIKLKELTNCHDVLMMSGTPVKATANEIVPSLRMIDPHFTPKLAELYDKVFKSSSVEVATIVKSRFRRTIYRKLKREVLQLPDKYISDLKLSIPKPGRYDTSKVKKEIDALFHKLYLERLESGLFTNNKTSPFYRASAGNYNFEKEKQDFSAIVLKYSRAKRQITEDYLHKIFQDRLDEQPYQLINSLNVEDEYFKFLNRFVVPFVPKDQVQYVTKRMDGIFGWAVAAKSASGSAIGSITAKYKNECFSEIWKYNYQKIIDMIGRNEKKTIIFSAMVPVVETISEDLEKRGIENIKVSGTNAGRIKLVNEFKNDPNIKVLIATTQTLSLGMTFTEATQVFFFGTPYRYSDFEQACDRIHRIGQEDPCYIYNILLASNEKNITGRIDEILNWSGEMFDALINEEFQPYE